MSSDKIQSDAKLAERDAQYYRVAAEFECAARQAKEAAGRVVR